MGAVGQCNFSFFGGIDHRYELLILFFPFCQTIVTTSSVSHEHLEYETTAGTYVYPEWADKIGIMFVVSSTVLIPVTAIGVLIRSPGRSLKEVRPLEESAIWGGGIVQLEDHPLNIIEN